MNADELKLVARLREQRLNPLGRAPAVIQWPEVPAPRVNLWPLFPYVAGIGCCVALIALAGW